MNKLIFFKIYFSIARIVFKIVIPPVMIVYTYLCVFREGRKRRKRQRSGANPRLVWGPIPIINNKYYNQAMKAAGYDSKTFMKTYYDNINKPDDFDLYYEAFAPKSPKFFAFDVFYTRYAAGYRAFCYAINRFDIFHHSFTGGFLHNTFLKKKEAQLLKRAGCKVVTMGYGADFFRYSKVADPSWLHGLNSHYPSFGRNEEEVEERVMYWRKHSDCIINGLHIDQLGRWDVLPFRAEVIDLDSWKPREKYSDFDGINGTVKLVHAPNHRVLKGTEFLLKAVNELQAEGLKLELILLERRKNEEVRNILHQEADIFFDQSVLGYALSAIEAFASGLPVMTNLEIEYYSRVFRRYSFLNECPALSVTNESIKENLKILVRNPRLRRQLGEASRVYAEKYHSYKTAASVFGKVYDKIWHGKEVDLANLYHPLFPSSYNNSLPLVEHPLVENKIPASLLKELA